jgi:hypothetical protein
MDAAIFYPDPRSLSEAVDRKAKDVCDRCPVIDECFQAGLVEPHGTWGGMNEVERKRFLK